ncbi:hypothetical protein J6590_058456 [Homalodisca vitripennis]|nr:hypothetical protein J6590_058456 [Homalodisca vitripennis]
MDGLEWLVMFIIFAAVLAIVQKAIVLEIQAEMYRQVQEPKRRPSHKMEKMTSKVEEYTISENKRVKKNKQKVKIISLSKKRRLRKKTLRSNKQEKADGD